MEYLGVVAFIFVLGVMDRVRKLEKKEKQRNTNTTKHKFKELINKEVKITYADDYFDTFIPSQAYVTLLDCDDEWLLIHFKNTKKDAIKMIRIIDIDNIEIKKTI